MKLLISVLMKLGLADYMARQLHVPNGWFGSRFIGKMMNRGNAELEALAWKQLHELKPATIVEIGFGNGKLLQQICETFPTATVHGIDVSEDMIQQVSERLKVQVTNGQLKLHLSGVSEMPLPDGSVDAIITCNTIYFWPNPEKDARELLRVLKPGGRLICGYRTKDDMANYPFAVRNPDIFKNRYNESEVKELFLDAGFASVAGHTESSELATSYVAVASK